jgi:hypothetical protein
METQIAKIVDWSHSEDENGNLHFDTKILVESGLYNRLMEFRSDYQKAAETIKQTNLALMEDKHDKLLLEHRRVLAVHAAIENEIFVSLQKHGDAEAALFNAANSLNNLRHLIEILHPKHVLKWQMIRPNLRGYKAFTTRL